jgi:hypothetical protein
MKLMTTRCGRVAGARDIVLRCLVVICAVVVATGCWFVPRQPTETHIIENEHAESLRRVFGTKLPEDVTVLNSAYTEYLTTPYENSQWRFELVATPEWIKYAKHHLNLRRQTGHWPSDRLGKTEYEWFNISNREEYDSFHDYTSNPYLFLHVKREPDSDGRHHVFASRW